MLASLATASPAPSRGGLSHARHRDTFLLTPEGLPGLPGWLLRFLLFGAAKDCHPCETSDGKDIAPTSLWSKISNKIATERGWGWKAGELAGSHKDPGRQGERAAGQGGGSTGRLGAVIPSALCSKTEPLIACAWLAAALDETGPPGSAAAWAGAAHGARGGKGREISLYLLFPCVPRKVGISSRLAPGRSELGNVQTAIKLPNLKRK